jgi:hypothetical protein
MCESFKEVYNSTILNSLHYASSEIQLFLASYNLNLILCDPNTLNGKY